MPDCIFCKIAKKEEKTEIIYEDDETVAFKDIYPKAPFHLLIVPKRHIESVATLRDEDKETVSHLIFVAKKIAEEKKISGYKLLFNVGKDGGQIVEHLHLHLLSGKTPEIP